MKWEKVQKISIVTVCLNARDSIRLTMDSVARQTFAHVEHVIIDGGSTDGTQDIVHDYDVGYFVSEKDNGVYHAMEKGARAATGDVLIFLNAGDTFYDEYTCEEVAAFFDETRADIVFGNLMPVYLNAADTHDHDAFRPGQLLDLGYVSNRRQLYDESIHHQATFYRKWIFKRCSYLCEIAEASGEYNVLLSAVMKHNARVRHIPRPVARFVLGGISTRNFETEWAKYVKARDILRRLYIPQAKKIKIDSETEFHYRPRIAPPRASGKEKFKRMIKDSMAFSAYERISLGLTTRLINMLMPRIENLLEAHTQRIFNDLSHVIQQQQTQYKSLLRRHAETMEHSLERRFESVQAAGRNEHARTQAGVLDAVHRIDSANRNLLDIANRVELGNRNLADASARLQINLADVATGLRQSDDFMSSGYRVFSQWNEDGLIQYLIARARISQHTFVEIGVGDYSEANTRLLLQKNNWSGMIVDCGAADMEKVRNSEIYWRYSVKAVDAFVDCDNVNRLLLENGISGETGLLSIDVDGVDYWIWKAISAISPQIVICEYNGIFGSRARVTVPYDPAFDRTAKHYSWLYAGASLAALEMLGQQKGYTLVGTNSGGNNAFFLRNDVLARSGIKPSPQPYTRPMFRESRNPDGSLAYLDIADGVKLIGDLKVYDVEKDALVRIRDIDLAY